MSVKAIRTEAGYETALARIDALMDAEPGTPEGEEGCADTPREPEEEAELDGLRRPLRTGAAATALSLTFGKGLSF